jgi:hypothetical protein
VAILYRCCVWERTQRIPKSVRERRFLLGWSKVSALTFIGVYLMVPMVDLLISHFGSQRCKQWFEAAFLGLVRLRGMECRANAMRKRSPRAWLD